MSYQKISDELYEKYIDVSVGVLMECYVSSLMEDVERQTASQCQEEVAFPEQLDNRCRALIAKEHACSKRKQFLKGATKCLSIIAVVALVISFLSGFLFLTVEAVRTQIINYYIERSDNHWSITSDANDPPEEPIDEIDAADPLADLIPDTYALNSSIGDSLQYLVVEYLTTSGDRVVFTSEPISDSIMINEETAHVSQRFELVGCDALLVVDDYDVLLFWVHEETATTFTLIANRMSVDEVVSIAENLIYKLSH